MIEHSADEHNALIRISRIKKVFGHDTPLDPRTGMNVSRFSLGFPTTVFKTAMTILPTSITCTLHSRRYENYAL